MPKGLFARVRTKYAIFAVCLWSIHGARLAAAVPAWLRIETPEFVAYSDAPEKEAVEFALDYAVYRQAFRELFSAPGHALPPSTLLLFRRTTTFEAHTPKARTHDTTLTHYTVDVDGTALLALALSTDHREALARTLEFETTWGLRRMGYSLPVWLTQGAGEVLATIEVSKGKYMLGREDSGHAEKFSANRNGIAWPRFFEIGEGSPEYVGKQATGAFHSQAWALMHWILFKDDRTRERFQTLASNLRTTPGLDAVQTLMDEPPENFRRAIREHLRRFRQPRSVPFDEAAVRASLKIVPAPEAEVLTQTSNLLAAAGRLEECNRQLERARQLAPDRADVKEAWARRALREGRPDEAAALYREAIAAGSTNFAAYLHSARARLDAGAIGNTDRAGEGGPETLVALREIRRALELNPGSSEAYRLLGRAFWLLPNVSEELVPELSRGVTSGDAGSRVRYYRGLLHSRLGNSADCYADLQQIIDDPDVLPLDRDRARDRLAYERYASDLKQVTELSKAKRFDDARALLRGKDQEETDRATARRYQELSTWLEENAAWDNLMTLAKAARWAELSAATQKYIADFPASPRRTQARRLQSEAGRMEQLTPRQP